MNQDLMNRIVMVVGNQQNEISKLNAGQIREMVKLILNALATEFLGGIHQQVEKENHMPAKKKGAAKKAKPSSKPMPKKK